MQTLSSLLFRLADNLLELCFSIGQSRNEIPHSEDTIVHRTIGAALESAQFVLKRIDKIQHRNLHWRRQDKLESISRSIKKIVIQLRDLDEAVSTSEGYPTDSRIRLSLLSISETRFSVAATELNRLGKYYGRKEMDHHMHGGPRDGVIFSRARGDGESKPDLSSGSEMPLAFMHRGLIEQQGNEKMETLVPVFFATDRIVDGRSQSPKRRFKNGRGVGVLTYGLAEVSIPRHHKIGKLERPAIWKFQFTENSEKHVFITSCEIKGENDWDSLAIDRMKQTRSSAALVFVHGYNTTFDQSIRSAAQIGYDLQFEGLITAYSWASAANVDAYYSDMNSALDTKILLGQFLLKLKNDLEVNEINVIAHSMGNRALINALLGMPKMQGDAHLLKEVVMAAPDVAECDFRGALAIICGIANRYTLYGSENDFAINISKLERRGEPRAGDGGKNIVVLEEAETVDASAVGGDVLGLGHDYISSKRTVLSDLYYLIRKSMPASDRHSMIKKFKNELPYWVFKP